MSCNHSFYPLCGCTATDRADEALAQRLDGWANSLTGIGTAAYDKRQHSELVANALSYQQLIHLRRYDDIGKKVVELVPAECFREGYEVTVADEGSYDDVKNEIEQGLRDVEADIKIEQAMRHQRAFGGSAILINVDDGGKEITDPMDLNNVHSLDSLNVLEPIEIFPVQFYQDPSKPKYGEPEYYQFNVTPVGAFGAGPVQVVPSPPMVNITRFVHESRLIVFGAHRASRYQHASGVSGISQFWGDPLFTLMVETLRDYHVSWASAGLLATDLGQPVISIENLLTLVAKDSDLLLKRMRAISLSRSTARAILIDTKEKFERQTTNLAGVPELLHELSNRMAAVTDIPLGLLTGYGSSGVGQTAEADVKNFYNKIRATQTRYISPVLRKLGTMIMKSKRSRKLPKNWGIRWNELEHMTDHERAESRRVQGQTDLMYLKGGVVTPDEIRKSRFFGGYSYETSVDEKQKAPGFITPLPAGVLPKAMTAEQVVAAKEAGEKPGAAPVAGQPAGGPGGHLVGGYARRNPTAPALGAMPKSSNGKEATPMHRDASDAQGPIAIGNPTDGPKLSAQGYVVDADDVTDPEYQREVFEKAYDAVYTDKQIADVKDLLAAHHDPQDCYDIDCPLCPLLGHMDDDGPGEAKYFAGLRIIVESPAGTTRSWTDTDGTPGSTLMTTDYGYIEGTIGTDGDSVDVYLGPDPTSDTVYVVHQMSVSSGFAAYDEDKCLLGFSSADAAKAAYLKQYDDPRFFGSMSVIPMTAFLRALIQDPAIPIAPSVANPIDNVGTLMDASAIAVNPSGLGSIAEQVQGGTYAAHAAEAPMAVTPALAPRATLPPIDSELYMKIDADADKK